jgi:methionyl-tRNA formyltransferase
MPPVKESALAEGIPVYQPTKLRRVEAVEHIRAWAPDLIVVAAYGQILPPSLLEIPCFGSLNVHASLLPRWRGAVPVQAAILAGDKVTGVTIMKMDAGLDTGPILAQQEVAIGPEETAGDLENRLADVGADLLIEILPDYLSGKLEPQPQPEEGITLARLFSRHAHRIQWDQPAEHIAHHVRAFAPKPGAYTTWRRSRSQQAKHFKILQAHAIETPPDLSTAPVGTTFKHEDFPAVVCGEGALVLQRVQMAGKRPMAGDAFLHGQRAFLGAVLGSPNPGDT